MSLRAQIEENGFAILPEAVGVPVLERLASALDRFAGVRGRAGLRHALAIPEIEQCACSSELIGIAAEVLGPEAVPFRATLFDKSDTANWLVVWHQDRSLPLRVRLEVPGWGPWSVKAGTTYAHAPATALEQVIALRLHLDDSTSDNGPLRVLPGTHRLGVLSEREIEELAQEITPVECTSPRGGVVAMRPLLVHASSKSRVQASRRVLHIEYASQDKFEGGLELAKG